MNHSKFSDFRADQKRNRDLDQIRKKERDHTPADVIEWESTIENLNRILQNLCFVRRAQFGESCIHKIQSSSSGNRHFIFNIKSDRFDLRTASDFFSRVDLFGETVFDEQAPDTVAEAAEALEALGFSRSEALKAVRKVNGAEQMESGELLKAALKAMRG